LFLEKSLLIDFLCFLPFSGFINKSDIKYENVIFESSKPNAEPKLIDFGLSKAYLGPDFQMTERVGTVYT